MRKLLFDGIRQVKPWFEHTVKAICTRDVSSVTPSPTAPEYAAISIVSPSGIGGSDCAAEAFANIVNTTILFKPFRIFLDIIRLITLPLNSMPLLKLLIV